MTRSTRRVAQALDLPRTGGIVGKYTVLVGFAVFSLFPLVWMWLAALRSSTEVYASPFSLPSHFDFGNIVKAWTVGRFSEYFLNSLIITVPTVCGVVAISALAATGSPGSASHCEPRPSTRCCSG